MKTLVVVSGGDAPGINAVLYHLAEAAAENGDTLIGALGGFPCILQERFVSLSSASLAPYAALGGSYLPSSREAVLKDPANHRRLKSILESHGFENLILFGGNGTLRFIPPILAEIGIACAGIPTTIDNDVAGTDLTLGFTSACDFAYAAIDGIKATAHALEGRFFTLETLGGNAGQLALAIAYASGADGVLLPEYREIDYDALAIRLKAAVDRKGYALLVYNEYIPDKAQMLVDLPDKIGIRLRDSRLGHAQRGAPITHQDRVMARAWAALALESVRGGTPMAITIWKNGQPALHHGLLVGESPTPDRALYNLINGISL